MAVRPDDKFLPLRNPGSKGWNAFDEPSSIDDLEVADVQNMVYDDGFIGPRQGSTIKYERPSAAVQDPLQLIKAQTSDGLRYLIAVYGNQFFVQDPLHGGWAPINKTYVPVETTRYYGNVNWNNGRGDDRLYLCNGVDDVIRWDICVDYAPLAYTAGSATITVNDGSRFPTGGGTLILNGNTSGDPYFAQPYTSRSGNVFTLTSPLLYDTYANTTVTLDMIQKSSMEVGKYLAKNQQRLIITNYYGGETVVWGSVQGDPEDFTLASTIAGAFTQTIADGNGEITGVHDFGQFLVIEKGDSVHTLQVQVASDLGSKLIVINPVLSGESLGPLAMMSTSKVMNKLYYPTRSNGFIALTPSTSGDSTSVDVTALSQKIDPFLSANIELSYSRTAAEGNKVYWAVALQGATQNTLVMQYDLLRQTWTKIFGWAAKDMLELDDEVLYLDSGTGHIYEINDGTYSDFNNEYMSSATFKRFDFGEIGRPKQQDLIYVEGLMTPASQFFFDVYFNEDGVLGKQTYRIDKNTVGLSFTAPITDAMGQFIMGTPIMGMSRLKGVANVSVFRCYLGLDISKNFYNIQPRVYGTRAAFWGIIGMAMNPIVLPIVPQDFIVNPILEE